jgi:hypothetical protein
VNIIKEIKSGGKTSAFDFFVFIAKFRMNHYNETHGVKTQYWRENI